MIPLIRGAYFQLIIATALMVAGDVSGQTFVATDPLPGDLETELALSALPPHIRAGAGVYHLTADGYELIRPPEGEFVCLVRRNGAVPGSFRDTLAPVCYDREGARTLLPAVLDEVEMVQGGTDPDAVRRRIGEAWEDGTYELPGPGISYMLSPVFRLNGRDDAYVPHVMFYGPGKNDGDVGATGDRLDHVPFIQAAGLPSAMMVVPVGEAEREAIRVREGGLIERVGRYLDGLER